MTCCEHSWAPVSSLVCSWVPRSTREYGAMVQWALMSADECPWPHGAMLMTALELSWVLIAPGSQAYCFSWVLLMSNHEHSWAPNTTHEHSKPAKSSHEQSWAWYHGAMSNNESTGAVMSMAPWGYECSSALMSAHCTMAPYSWVLLGTHEHKWALMGAKERSQQVMSAEPFHQTINKKC